MKLTRLFPIGDAASVDIRESDARARLSRLYELRAPSYLRLNLIASVNGSAVGTDGTSESLTNRADRTLLGVIRGQADVVLVGATSVRAEGYQVPRTARLAIVTSTGVLDGHRVRADIGGDRVLVLCPASAVDTVTAFLGSSAEIVVVTGNGVAAGSGTGHAGHVSLPSALDALRARGLSRIVCEGGPSLARQLLDLGLVDELCLSTGPIITSASAPLFGENEITQRQLELTQLLMDDASGLYARWAVTPSRP